MPTQITPCLWFNGQAGEAAKHYCSIFPDGTITQTQYYTSAGQENHQFPAGHVMMVSFTINGTSFTALNGPPLFTHSEAISFQVICEDQKEVDYYWEKLGEGGDEKKRVCGWLGDKFGISWQVIPKALCEYMNAGGEKGARATKAMMGMGKLDIEGLRKAFEGEE